MSVSVSVQVRRGSVAEGSELELEVAEADIDGLALDGSLRIIASAPLGPLEPSAPNPATATGAGAGGVGGGEGELLLRYDDTRAGRVRMRDVTVKNAGVDWCGSPRPSYSSLSLRGGRWKSRFLL